MKSSCAFLVGGHKRSMSGASTIVNVNDNQQISAILGEVSRIYSLYDTFDFLLHPCDDVIIKKTKSKILEVIIFGRGATLEISQHVVFYRRANFQACNQKLNNYAPYSCITSISTLEIKTVRRLTRYQLAHQ